MELSPQEEVDRILSCVGNHSRVLNVPRGANVSEALAKYAQRTYGSSSECEYT